MCVAVSDVVSNPNDGAMIASVHPHTPLIYALTVSGGGPASFAENNFPPV